MEIINVPLVDIKIDDRFRKVMGNTDELGESIKSIGLIQPITLDQDYNLLAGHRRWVAFSKLGMDEIPCIIRKVDGPIDALEIELFENIHRKDLTWSEEVALVEKIHGTVVKGRGSKTKVAKLLSKKRSRVSQQLEIAKAIAIIPELANCGSEDEARKKFKKLTEKVLVDQALATIKKSRKGTKKESPRDKYLRWADDHYIIGDALKGMRELEPGNINFAEVDPPYAIELHEKKSKGSANIEHYNEISRKDYPKFLYATAKLVYRSLDHNATCVWWFGSEWHEIVRDILKSVEFKVDDIPAIWYKVDSSSVSNTPDIYLSRSYEPFFICRKGTPAIRKRGRSNVFAYKTVKVGSKIHPTERPIDLIEELYDTFVYPGGRVLSPFLGSGASLIAAYNKGLTAFGWEITDAIKPQFLARVNELVPDVIEEKSTPSRKKPADSVKI